MARLLPGRISEEVTSSAERRVFEWFGNDTSTTDWIVLHSLGLARHESLVFGEVDFVVIAPNLGIFCLEVKGGRVARENGLWTFTNRFGETSRKARGPFDQAREGMFSLISELERRLPGGEGDPSALLFGFGVIFPDIDFNVPGPDYDLSQVWCRSAIAREGIGDFVRKLALYTRGNQARIYSNGAGRRGPTLRQAKLIADSLRGDFDRPVLLSAQLDETDRRIGKLTREQFRCLDMFEDNKRLLVEGSAGTGKTLLAIEMAHRSMERGERVALFCYNSGLGNWLKDQFPNAGENASFVGTFHAFLQSMAASCPANPSHRYFAEELPRALLTQGGLPAAKFDRIVIDEAQDLIEEEYFLVLDVVLRNGVDRGAWALFGDFETQAIYQRGKTRAELIGLVEGFSSFAQAKLTINCRNTRSIGITAELLCGVRIAFSEDAVMGPPVTYITWGDEEDEAEKLAAQVQGLLREGVSATDIVILTPMAPYQSVASAINDSADSRARSIKVSSIAAFKGLESRVVILADCSAYTDPALCYVGLTRARAKLIIFESEQARAQRTKLLEERLHGL